MELSFFLGMPDVAFAVAEPAARSDFLLREKLDAFAALHVQIAEEGFVPTVERKPRHRSGHANIDADHAAIDSMLEFARGFARAREDGRAIAVKGFVRQFDGFVQIFHVHHVQHRTENNAHGRFGQNHRTGEQILLRQ